MFNKTKCETDRLLQIGVISKVEQPTGLSAQMVLIPKPNLNKLNKNLPREAYALPSVEFTIRKLRKS